jgi:Immune inhibitor A peptidase M6
LIWYWDTSHSDNNTSVHPGEGLIIPVDSHPRAIYRITDGLPWRCRIQMYDAPFSLTRAESFTLHVNSEPSYIRGQDAVPVFDDRRSYWDPATPACSVQVPNTGVRIRCWRWTERRSGSGRPRLPSNSSGLPLRTGRNILPVRSAYLGHTGNAGER